MPKGSPATREHPSRDETRIGFHTPRVPPVCQILNHFDSIVPVLIQLKPTLPDCLSPCISVAFLDLEDGIEFGTGLAVQRVADSACEGTHDESPRLYFSDCFARTLFIAIACGRGGSRPCRLDGPEISSPLFFYVRGYLSPGSIYVKR